MASYNIEDIIAVLREEKIAPQTLVNVESKLEKIAEEKKEDRVSTPRQKNEFVIVVRGDESLKKVLAQGWVVQVKSGADIQNLPSEFKEAAKENNASFKRKKSPVSTVRDFFAYVKRPFVKSRNINIKTKEPCQVVVLTSENITDNNPSL